MKFLPLRDFDDVTSALNFDTADCHVIGGCDLYTTKAAGSDKKLYRSIEHSLESQYESLLRLSASLSPPQASSAASSLNLSRSSPFGPLSQISSRRTFAYLIATLNASHPDYDFSHLLRPTDFRRERNLKTVMNTLDTTLYNLRPRPFGSFLTMPSSGCAAPPPLPGGSQSWGPRMWALIDKEMSLRECSIYCYAPEEDPYDGEEGAIWSLNYFFFNKARKRVCYIYLRGLSIMSHSPVQRIDQAKKTGASYARAGGRSSGASKRATYWLGERPDGTEIQGGQTEDDDDVLITGWDDDEVDVVGEVLDDGDELVPEFESDPDDVGIRERAKGAIRGMSEDIAESMEV
ncbi:MAG: RNA polymerase III-inhibiting protein maf1 [Thelocarpon impressellum]|nr:MAG: RNA polymerase III-inhibiting protein maf1 [Thelocarpon impressellum]